MTLSLPPIGAFFVLLATVPGFIILAQHCKTKTCAFLTGWAFGAGYFIFGLYWISAALFVDIAAWWWVLPLSGILGPAALALFYGFIPLLAWRYRKNDAAYALMTVAAWSLIEWLRGHLFTGFPWNLAGYTWHHVLPVMQANAAIGIYGLTLVTLLLATSPLQRKFMPGFIALFIFLVTSGMARLNLNPTEQSGNVTVRIVQPNIAQTQKWKADEEWRNFEKYLDLTQSPTNLKQPITFVVWPETAVLSDLRLFPEIARHIAVHLPKNSLAVIGNLRVTEGAAGENFFNSVSVLNKKANVIGIYDKHHLVPFGEYIPYRNHLNMTPIANGIANIGDFTKGGGVTTLNMGLLPRPSPLICYEAIFPGKVARRDDRPDWLVNVTNDAWYRKTAGPHQHFEIARVRAVEEGLPLVRAANTGISATIDPLGRIIALKSLEETGVVDTILPRPLPPTIYARFGDSLFFLMLVLLAIGAEAPVNSARSGRRRK
jgi:apolipoprotein N-acyltransferase